MAYDFDYWNRLQLLYDLAIENPESRMRDLQIEALKYFPLCSISARRRFLSIETAYNCFSKFDNARESE